MHVKGVLFQQRLGMIGEKLADASLSSRVVLEEKVRGFSVRFFSNFEQWVPIPFSFLLQYFNPDYCSENRKTIETLFEMFGRRRTIRVFQRQNIDILSRWDHGREITVGELRNFFIGVADVRYEDIEQVVYDLQHSPESYLHLLPVQLSRLRARLAGKTIHDLTKADIDHVYEVAVPFRSIEDIFLKRVPKFQWNSGGPSDPKAHESRVYLIEQMRRHSGHPRYAEWIRYAKRVMSYGIPEGAVLSDADGYRFVAKKERRLGCYALYQKRMHEGCRSQVAILGTQSEFWSVPYAWETFLQDLHPNLGASAAISMQESMGKMLTDVREGFIEREGEKVELIGMSLGGTIASFLTCMNLDKVDALYTVSSPGVDHKTACLFNELVEGRSTPIEIKHARDSDDLIPLHGETHLGIHANPHRVRLDVYMIAPRTEEADSLPSRPHASGSLLQRIWSTVSSLIGPHVRETTDDVFVSNAHSYTHRVFHRSNQNSFSREELDELLDNRGLGYERARQSLLPILGPPDLFVRHMAGA